MPLNVTPVNRNLQTRVGIAPVYESSSAASTGCTLFCDLDECIDNQSS